MAAEAVPASLEPYLLPRERLVAEVRWHWIWLARPTAVLVAVLVLLGWVAAGLPPRSVLAPWLPFVFLAACLWYGFVYWSWRRERLLVTDRRLLLLRGLIATKVGVMPLKKVTDMTYERPLTGRLLGERGWGTFVFESAGQNQDFHRIPFLPHPDDLYLRLTGQIFRDPAPAGGPDADD